MRWYWIYCPQCGWKSDYPVDEKVAERVRTEVRFCKECKEKKKAPSEFKFREVITSTRRGR